MMRRSGQQMPGQVCIFCSQKHACAIPPASPFVPVHCYVAMQVWRSRGFLRMALPLVWQFIAVMFLVRISRWIDALERTHEHRCLLHMCICVGPSTGMWTGPGGEFRRQKRLSMCRLEIEALKSGPPFPTRFCPWTENHHFLTYNVWYREVKRTYYFLTKKKGLGSVVYIGGWICAISLPKRWYPWVGTEM